MFENGINDSAIYSASSAITYASSLVFLFFLQTSMFRAFGDGSGFEATMNYVTAISVTAIILTMSLYMVTRANILISKEEKNI